MSALRKPEWRTPPYDRARLMPSRCPICRGPAHIPHMPIGLVLEIAAATFGVTRADMRGDSKADQLVKARAFATWALRSLGVPTSYAAIGRSLRRHFDTAINLHRKAIWLRLHDADFASACSSLSDRFYATREPCHASL